MGCRLSFPCLLACGLFAALALPASAAPPTWLPLGENARAEIYIDAANVERPAGHVKVWTMLSYKRRQRGGFLSERRLFLYSCRDQTLEWQQSMYYADALGEGDLVNARALTRYGVGDLKLAEFDPSTKDKRLLRDAVPETAFPQVFKGLC